MFKTRENKRKIVISEGKIMLLKYCKWLVKAWFNK